MHRIRKQIAKLLLFCFALAMLGDVMPAVQAAVQITYGESGLTAYTVNVARNTYFEDIVEVNGKVFAITWSGNLLQASADLSTWTPVAAEWMSRDRYNTQVVYGNGVFLARAGSTMFRSEDGETWKVVNSYSEDLGGVRQNVYYLGYANNLFQISGGEWNRGGYAGFSADGKTWYDFTDAASDGSMQIDAKAVFYDLGKFAVPKLAGGEFKVYSVASTGIANLAANSLDSWTSTSSAFGANDVTRIITEQDYANTCSYSYVGQNNLAGYVLSVAGSTYRFYTSPDFITWTEQTDKNAYEAALGAPAAAGPGFTNNLSGWSVDDTFLSPTAADVAALFDGIRCPASTTLNRGAAVNKTYANSGKQYTVERVSYVVNGETYIDNVVHVSTDGGSTWSTTLANIKFDGVITNHNAIAEKSKAPIITVSAVDASGNFTVTISADPSETGAEFFYSTGSATQEVYTPRDLDGSSYISYKKYTAPISLNLNSVNDIPLRAVAISGDKPTSDTEVFGATFVVDRVVEQPVRYVPYQYIFELLPDAPDRADLTFYTQPANILDGTGLTLKQDGEIYGTPLFENSYTFVLCVNVPGVPYPDKMEVKLEIQDPSDAKVEAKNDHAIITPVGGGTRTVSAYADDLTDQVFKVDGAFDRFVDFWIDGAKKARGVDYTVADGSTVITVKAQTFKQLPNGQHTIAAEFLAPADPTTGIQTKTRVAQNVKLDLRTGSGNSGNQSNSGSNSSSNGGYSGGGYNYVPIASASPSTAPSSSAAPSANNNANNGTSSAAKPLDAAAIIAKLKDVSATDWFSQDVVWAYQNGVMVGVSADSFAPNSPTTPAMAAVTLANILGVDLKPYQKAGDTWYTAAMAWANAVGLFADTGGLAFDAPLSRGQLMVVVVKALRSAGIGVDSATTTAVIVDSGDMSAAELEAFKILNGLGIVQGRGGGVMDPTAKATRAELAAVLHNTDKYVKKLKSK